MKVKELIEQLRGLPQDEQVVIWGDGWSLEVVKSAKTIKSEVAKCRTGEHSEATYLYRLDGTPRFYREVDREENVVELLTYKSKV